MKYKHLFGPVMSRRLGVSLGVDLVPYKYCPLSCVYCEVQKTTHLITERQEFFPVAEIITELDSFMQGNPHLDYITFSGAGEPTLNSGIGQIIQHIKMHYPSYRLALLTNGVLLNDPQVLSEILPCDLILPSLDAASQEVYEKVNRPKPGLLITDLIDGLINLRVSYPGKIWLEVFIVPGITDTENELTLLAEAITRISPNIVQLNSLDRPGAEDWVEATSPKRLKEIKAFMSARLSMPVEIIAKIKYDKSGMISDEDLLHQIHSTLLRRPSTAEDISAMLDVHINEVSKILRELVNEGKIEAQRGERGVFYLWKS